MVMRASEASAGRCVSLCTCDRVLSRPPRNADPWRRVRADVEGPRAAGTVDGARRGQLAGHWRRLDAAPRRDPRRGRRDSVRESAREPV